ncbi:hypothetical protein DMENIID0001_036360 [Sergentomyia squamirostris]
MDKGVMNIIKTCKRMSGSCYTEQTRADETTTGKTPTELCIGRTIRGKIPGVIDLESAPPDTDFAERDLLKKQKGKEVAERARWAKTFDMSVGDRVLGIHRNCKVRIKSESSRSEVWENVRSKRDIFITPEDDGIDQEMPETEASYSSEIRADDHQPTRASPSPVIPGEDP